MSEPAAQIPELAAYARAALKLAAARKRAEAALMRSAEKARALRELKASAQFAEDDRRLGEWWRQAYIFKGQKVGQSTQPTIDIGGCPEAEEAYQALAEFVKVAFLAAKSARANVPNELANALMLPEPTLSGRPDPE
jgi:hypothetical protein